MRMKSRNSRKEKGILIRIIMSRLLVNIMGAHTRRKTTVLRNGRKTQTSKH